MSVVISLLTPTKGFVSLHTILSGNTSTICFNLSSCGVETGTGGFSLSSLGSMSGVTGSCKTGACLYAGAVLGSELTYSLSGGLSSVTSSSVSKLVLSSVKLVSGAMSGNLSTRVDIRRGISGSCVLGALGGLNTGETVLSHSLSLESVASLTGGSPVSASVFIRNTIYVTVSKHYFLDCNLCKEDTGYKSYLRPYHGG